MPARPFLANPPLRFRGIPDSLAELHLEGSECCLIHADNPLSVEKGVYLNPRVRVGYNGAAYAAVHPIINLLSPWRILRGVWGNRLLRLVDTSWFKAGIIREQVRRWQSLDTGNAEDGQICIINEMQILRANGWMHV